MGQKQAQTFDFRGNATGRKSQVKKPGGGNSRNPTPCPKGSGGGKEGTHKREGIKSPKRT